ncbi:polysaccharide pyruvyl transferase family protein [Paenibacillus glycanilyticus]|uniref:polysaccharide pyruvyl transferase family protein n=1 Tax=Paenibacillus glycanilyticus TaxID=126569 RepID=UPI00203ACD2A|nr:polysaccharide pyruvyl transferase family protein [Paenibacillus glycanilyticus]MCM3630343.1 polysaccharide pyruvyl transferase family protein [Paenibacillus glycanilyticus]
MLNLIKKSMPDGFKFHMKYLVHNYFGKNFTSKFDSTSNQQKVFIMIAADYGNLGDVAITEAQYSFLQHEFVDDNSIVYPIYVKDTLRMLRTLKKVITPNDLITIIGGGNMGDLYEGAENLRRIIIKTFPENKIISFPQTIDFSNSSSGQKSLEKSVKIYNSHSNLHIFARETESYDTMKKLFFNNSVNLVPDIVLSLKLKDKETKQRKGIVLCLRDDLEAKIAADKKYEIINMIQSEYCEVTIKDTYIGSEGFSQKLLKDKLYELLSCFSRSQLVITDRLHGMIFCVITGTPCIVMPNSNHKVTGTVRDWLSKLDHIKLLTEIKDLAVFQNEVENLISMSEEKIIIPDLSEYYLPLKKLLV